MSMNEKEYKIYEYDRRTSREEDNLVQKLYEEFMNPDENGAVKGISQLNKNLLRSAFQECWILANLYRTKMILDKS
jgi:hypothetical protein